MPENARRRPEAAQGDASTHPNAKPKGSISQQKLEASFEQNTKEMKKSKEKREEASEKGVSCASRFAGVPSRHPSHRAVGGEQAEAKEGEGGWAKRRKLGLEERRARARSGISCASRFAGVPSRHPSHRAVGGEQAEAKAGEGSEEASEGSEEASEGSEEASEGSEEASEEASEGSEEASEEASEGSEEASEGSEEASEGSEEAKAGEGSEEASEGSEEASEGSEEGKFLFQSQEAYVILIITFVADTQP